MRLTLICPKRIFCRYAEINPEEADKISRRFGLKLKVTLNNLLEIFEQFQSETGMPYQLNGCETTFRLPQQLGMSLMRHWHLRDGLDLYIQNYQLTEPIVFESTNYYSMFGLSYSISGTTEMLFDRSRFGLEIRPGSCLSIQMTAAQSSVQIPAHQPICIVDIAISPNLIQTFIANEIDLFSLEIRRYLQGFDSFYWQHTATTAETTTTLNQILNCPYQGATQQLYLEGKVLELVAVQLNQLKLIQAGSSRKYLKSDDIDRIYQAREILIQNSQHPPSLLALAHQVGLNDYKLKQGFRQVFGTTAFGCLHQYRMEQARQLLETQKIPVEIAAHTVGYASLSSFHRAYKKHFGINPGTYRNGHR